MVPATEGDLSLVLLNNTPGHEGQRVCLFNWYVVNQCGRIADIDDQNRAKSIVPTGAKRYPISIGNGQIIWPSTKIPATRTKAQFRQPVPEPVLRVKSLWEAAIQIQADGGVFSSTDVCEICERSSVPILRRFGQEREDLPCLDDTISFCPLCCMSVHKYCCQSLLGKFGRALANRSNNGSSSSSLSSASSSKKLSVAGVCLDVSDFPVNIVGSLQLPRILLDAERRGTESNKLRGGQWARIMNGLEQIVK